jgi:hypothetical protein
MSELREIKGVGLDRLVLQSARLGSGRTAYRGRH